jgi:F-type H+-transporting ATPase subunit gamma
VAQAREIRRRIRSVENTRKITKTMEMVATSKMKRATDRVYAARPYGAAIDRIVHGVRVPDGAEALFPILRRPSAERRAAVLLLTANRGLAGGFNANLIKEAALLLERLRGEGVETELHIAGKKGISYFRFRGEELSLARTDIGDRPSLEDAESLVEPLQVRFEAGEIDSLYVVSSEFKSALSTPPVVRKLLPIESDGGAQDYDGYILSPGPAQILHRLLPRYVKNVVYRALVENAAAEQGARRTAMKSATDNAGDMVDSLTRTYNRARQAQITQEIAEIVGGAAGLE